MSLDCEGDGATCMECCEFDFLPYHCTRCRGTFCAAHATHHHRPGQPSTATATSSLNEDRPLCSAGSSSLPSIPTDDATTATTASSSASPLEKCVICNSLLYGLPPCSICHQNFCAIHRFHCHDGDTAEGTGQRRRERRPPPLQPSARGDHHGGEGNSSELHSLCSPYRGSHALVIGPSGYRSRWMQLVVIIAAPSCRTVSTAVTASALGSAPSCSLQPPMESGGKAVKGGSCEDSAGKDDCETADRCSDWEFGVCSVLAAAEMVAGQLGDRLMAFLGSTSTKDLVPSPPARVTHLYTIKAAEPSPAGYSKDMDQGGGAPAKVGETEGVLPQRQYTGVSRKAPPISLVELPLSSTLRTVPISHATLLLVLPAPVAAGPSPSAALLSDRLRPFLQALLFPRGAVAEVRSSSGRHQLDERLRALATRLYLQYQQQQRSAVADQPGRYATEVAAEDTAATAAVLTTVAPREMGVGDEALPTPITTAGPCTAAAAADPSVSLEPRWPFQTPPPLHRFTFFNTKLKPLGAASAVKPSSAPRATVAVFIADATLPSVARPLCITVGADWPPHRLAGHVTETLLAAQPALCNAAVALRGFGLYELSGTMPWVKCLFTGSGAGAATSTPLPNGTVLLLCPPEEAAIAAVRIELQGLQGASAKEKAAMKADMLRKCTLM